MASRLRFLLLALVCSIGVSSSVAAAPPVVAPISSHGVATLEVAPVFLGDSQNNDANWLLTSSYSGQVVYIVGLAWKDCAAASDAQHTMYGNSAPYTSASASITAVELGAIASAGNCLAAASSSVSWDFGFYSPTFDALGGQLLPIAFSFSGDATASGLCFGPTGCLVTATKSQINVGAAGLGNAQVNALETGPTHVNMNVDFVGDMSQPWSVIASAEAWESAGPGTPGVPDGGSSMSVVSNLAIVVDFVLTETLIKAADPSLPQATIDQGLADLELIVSPGVDIASIAPQFVPEPTGGTLLGAGVVALVSLARRRTGGLNLRRRRDARGPVG